MANNPTVVKGKVVPPAPSRPGVGTTIIPSRFSPTDTLVPLGNMHEPEDQIRNRITKTFKIADKLLRGVVSGDLTGMMMSGLGGVGKTFGAEKILDEAAREGSIELTKFNTYVTPVELYKLLYDNKDITNVTIIDDCDNIWKNMQSIGILKAALDSKPERVVHWKANSHPLRKDDIPSEFLMQGAVIFITNVDLRASIDRGDAWAKHHHAILRRITYLDMGIHTKREVFVRIKQLLEDDGFVEINQLTPEINEKIIKWMLTNLEKIHSLSINTCMKLAQYIRTDPEDWEELAEVTLFRRS